MRKTIIGMVPEESPIYSLHPATRLIIFVITGFLPVFLAMPEANLTFLFLIIVLFRLARVDLRSLKIYVPMIVTVGVFIFLTYIFFPGKDPSYIPVGRFLGRTVYYQPLRWAAAAYIRILALLFASIFYFSTNRERDILAGFRSLGLPFAASYFLGLTLRVAGMFLEDFRTIREAERARGLDTTKLSFGDKVKLYAMYTVPLFSLALRRGDDITNALFVKGHTLSGKVEGGRADYILTKYRRSPWDIPLSALLGLAFLAVIYVRYRYNFFSLENSPVNRLLMDTLTGGGAR